MTTDIGVRDDRAPTFTDDTREHIRRTLLDALAEQRRALRDHTAALDDVDGEADPNSRALAATSRQRANDAVVDIEQALARVDTDTYGACERCGDVIAPARLEALPATRSCIECATGGSRA